MPNVVVVSRYFPPLSSAGSSIRLIKFIKYAAPEGWKFRVVTQDPDRPVVPEKFLSGFLLDEIPSETEIIRIGNPIFEKTPFNRLLQVLFKQSSLPWGLSVFFKCQRLFHNQKPDLIFVNSPPFTNAAIGYGLAIALRVPLVLDMKDDWIDSAGYRKKGKFRQFIDRWIERKIVARSRKVTTVTRLSYEASLQRYSPSGLADRFAFIPNGEDLNEFVVLRSRIRKKEDRRFHLMTSAAGYRPEYRDLTPFLDTLENFLLTHPEARKMLDIEFIGDEIGPIYRQRLEKILPAGQVIYTGILERSALINRLWMADLFFLVQPRLNSTAISGTLYEYWATGKAPVLLFSEKGASSEMIIQNKLGSHFLFTQIEEASRFLDMVYKASGSSQPFWIEPTGAEKFDRKELATQMISVWADAIKQGY